MKKYAIIFSIAWQRALTYRGVSLIFTLFFLINVLLSFAIWAVALQSTADLMRLFSKLVMYFSLLIFVHQLIQSYTAGVISHEHIKQGELSIYLLKPFPYLRYMFILEIPWRIVQCIFSLPVAAVCFFIFQRFFSWDVRYMILGSLILPLAYLLSFLIQLLVAHTAFWFDDATGFLNVIEVLTLLFSGAGIPIFLFPQILKQIGSWLPFQYAMFFPVATLAGFVSPDDYWRNVIILLAWIVGLGLVVSALWRRGLRRFTGEGI